MKEQLQSKFEQLATASTQLKDASEQLEKLQKVSEEKKVRLIHKNASHSRIRLLLLMNDVLVEQDTELGQLRQALEQLWEEKAKETGRASKLVEELNSEYSLAGVTVEVTSSLDGTL